MRILFLSYWSVSDPLTKATILPHLRLLQARADVVSICLVTIERDNSPAADYQLELPYENAKITFWPLKSRTRGSVLLTKAEDFTVFPNELTALARRQGSTLLLARGAPAGSLAYLVWRRTGIPFMVESFEPHGQYMLAAGVWSRYDPRYWMEQYWEKKQRKHARFLITVADNYRQHLVATGVPARRVLTAPCAVSLADFAFRAEQRGAIRQQLGWAADAVVGVYAGKFGGIYYDEEAFQLFRQVADFFGPGFRLLLLTPLPSEDIAARLAAAGLPAPQTHVTKVPFAEVPNYLSAADFAFGLHRPTPFVSPVKHGEYWANGLPILLPAGVGDDSAIIEREGGGAVFDLTASNSVAEALGKLREQLVPPAGRLAGPTVALAHRHRSLELVRVAYDVALRALPQGSHLSPAA